MWQAEAEVGKDPIAWGRCGGLPGRGRLGMDYKDYICSFIHSLSTYLLSIFYVPGTWTRTVNKTLYP